MKTSKLILAFAFTMLTSLCSCYDFELDLGTGFSGGSYGGGSYSGNFDYEVPYQASFYIDSATQASTSKIILWSHIQFDSVLIIKYQQTNHYEINKSGTEVIGNIQSQPVTIDFRTLPDSVLNSTGIMEGIYKYKLEIQNLKQNVDYSVCIYNDFIDGKVRTSTQQCITVRLK